jgi:glycosyltransferase involved in cell wall biosynthesis
MSHPINSPVALKRGLQGVERRGMKSLLKISVVIPCFNHGEFLPEAVESVERIKRDDVEMVVVDDGSTDERTTREISNLEARGIKVIRQENKGLAAARNVAILASHAEYILPLDADDRVRSAWIQRGIQILDSERRVGVVYGDAECFGVRNGLWRTGPLDTNRLLLSNYIHTTALFRRSVWEQNGGYDGTMPVQGYEDWDFWLGALEHGWQLEYLPEIFFDYRQTRKSMITGTFGFEPQIEEFVARKHGPLYRHKFLALLSIKKVVRHLSALLVWRVKLKLNQQQFGPPPLNEP